MARSRVLGAGGQMVRVVAVMVMGVSWAWRAAGERSYVRYVDGGAQESFLVAPGRMITTTQAFVTLNLATTCECRRACWSSVDCVAAAAVAVSSGQNVKCHLAAMGPTIKVPIPAPGATYFFWNASVPWLYYGLQEDGLLYLVLREGMNFQAARNECLKLPGHRLALTKTATQHGILVYLATLTDKQLWVDLHSAGGPNDVPVWGDGTPFTTEAAGVTYINNDAGEVAFRMSRGGVLNDNRINKLYWPLCQAHPLGLDW